MKKVQNIQRVFCVGDQWLYYKIYCGLKTADTVLTEIFLKVSNRLLEQGKVSKWFFIRYSNPDHHLRWRLELSDTHDISIVISAIHAHLAHFVEHDLVHRVVIDTYKREIERYGSNSIVLAESLFCYDSKMISEMIDLIEGDEGEQIRWIFSMRAIDQLLTDFNYTTEQKFELLTSLSENFGKEFNINSSLIIQLSKKYRKEKKDIFDFMNRKKDKSSIYMPLFELLREKTENTKEVISQIISLHNNNNLQIPLNNLLSSFVHMMMNRIFRSRQRLHEMVIYGFLFRYYRSELAREKYNK